MAALRPAPNIIGQTLRHRYRVIQQISRGGMGAVFRGVDVSCGRDVALKQLIDSRHQRRFEAEARLLSTLSHPRVVKIVDHFSDSSGHYLVMELVRGVDLGMWLKQRGAPGLPVSEAVDYVAQACQALQYVHEQQIIHRDVKPQNMIVSERGVVLVDFGIARTLEAGELQGTVGVGTPRFMAPEVYATGAISPRTDVFGIAATLWTLVAGRVRTYAEPARLSEIVPEVPPHIERTIAGGLELSPERRTASIQAFARGLGASGVAEDGDSLAHSIETRDQPRTLMQTIVRTAAGVFGAAASSVCLVDALTRELVYHSAWGAGAREIVGFRLEPGTGVTGHVIETGVGEAVADCRSDPRFAADTAAWTGYIPLTMLVMPLLRGERAIGALCLLDRRDGRPYLAADIERASLFAELVVQALDAMPDTFMGVGMTLPAS